MSQLQSTPRPGVKRTARQKSKGVKRRKRKSPKEIHELDSSMEADESDSSDNGEIDWRKLEADLEENAAKANLTAINVKTILHHILKDKRVIEYAQTAAGSSNSCADEGLTMTRAKARMLGHEPLIISKEETDPKPTILDLQFFSETSSDEEYKPKDDDEETSQASDEDLSTFSDFLSDAASPLLRTPASSVADLDTILESDDTEKSVTPRNQTLVSNNSVSEAVKEPGSAKKMLFKLPDPPAKSQEEIDLIATRTRSRFPMPNVEVEELEAAFKPPDSTALDFSVKHPDDPDEVIWMNWLSDFTKPIKALNDTADEDPNDEDFNYMEAADENDTEVETEELRDDKATRVTQKELQELFNELLLGFDQEKQQDMHCEQYFENWDQELKVKSEEYLPNYPDITKDLELTFGQYQQITAQMQQHIQLLTQVYLLSCTNSSLKEETMLCKQYIEELALFHNKAIENSKCEIGHVQAEYSTFCTPGITDAYRLIKSLNGTKIVTKVSKTKTTYYQINETIAQLITTEPYFATYIELLPEQGMQQINGGTAKRSSFSRMKFIKVEDNLLAIGISQFKGKDKFALIAEHLLPTKTPKQLEVRVKNLCSSREECNPVAVVKKENFLPELHTKVKITIPRAISSVPLYKLPRRIWKGRIAPPWYLKENKKLQVVESAKIKAEEVKAHETRNNLFNLVSKDEICADGKVMTPTSYMTQSKLTPPVNRPHTSQYPNVMRSPIDLSTSKHVILTPVGAQILSPRVLITPIGISPSENIITTPMSLSSENVITTPVSLSLSERKSGTTSTPNCPLPSASRSSTTQYNLTVGATPSALHNANEFTITVVSDSTTAKYNSIDECPTLQEDLTTHSQSNLSVLTTPVKRNNSNDSFNLPFTQLIKDLPSPKACPQLTLTPSKPLHETSFSEVKQLLKTPKKQHVDSVPLHSAEVEELLKTPKKPEGCETKVEQVLVVLPKEDEDYVQAVVLDEAEQNDTTDDQCDATDETKNAETKMDGTSERSKTNKTSPSSRDVQVLDTPKLNSVEVRKKKNVVKRKKKTKQNTAVFDYEARLKQKAKDIANIYFNRVKEVLKHEPVVCIKFFELMETVNSDKLTKLETYYKVADLLSDYPELVDNFAGFLEQHEARHVGKFMQWLMYDQVIQFHLSCEQYFFSTEGWYWKIIQKIIEVTEFEKDSQKIVDAITPMFKGNQELTDQFIRLFPDLPPPACNDEDFEVIDFAAVSAGVKEIDDFEEIAYQPPDGDVLSHDETKYRKKAADQSHLKKEGLAFAKKKSNTSITASKLRQQASKRKNKSWKSQIYPNSQIKLHNSGADLSCYETSNDGDILNLSESEKEQSIVVVTEPFEKKDTHDVSNIARNDDTAIEIKENDEEKSSNPVIADNFNSVVEGDCLKALPGVPVTKLTQQAVDKPDDIDHISDLEKAGDLENKVEEDKAKGERIEDTPAQRGFLILLQDTQDNVSELSTNRSPAASKEEYSKDVDFAVVSTKQFNEANIIEISSDTVSLEREAAVIVGEYQDEKHHALLSKVKQEAQSDVDAEVEVIMKQPIPAIQISTPKVKFVSPALDVGQIHNEDAQFNLNFKSPDLKVETLVNHPESDGQDLTFGNLSNVTSILSKASSGVEAEKAFITAEKSIYGNVTCELTFPDAIATTETNESDLTFKGKISPVKRRITKSEIITLETKDNMTHDDLHASEDFASFVNQSGSPAPSDGTLKKEGVDTSEMKKDETDDSVPPPSVEYTPTEVAVWTEGEDRLLLHAVAKEEGRLSDHVVNEVSLETGKTPEQIKNRIELLLQNFQDDSEATGDEDDDDEDDDDDDDNHVVTKKHQT